MIDHSWVHSSSVIDFPRIRAAGSGIFKYKSCFCNYLRWGQFIIGGGGKQMDSENEWRFNENPASFNLIARIKEIIIGLETF